jgi:hypothetical protein
MRVYLVGFAVPVRRGEERRGKERRGEERTVRKRRSEMEFPQQ